MIAFLFPGQGSQTPGMLQDFYENHERAQTQLDLAAGILGPEFIDTLFNGPEEKLRDTCLAQPALVLAGIIISEYLQSNGLTPTCVAGHSVGEIAALTVAGVLQFEDAIRLTQERARLMAEESPEGTMAAVMGLTPEAIQDALPEGAEIANLNGPQQTIISGTLSGIESATESLKAAGAKRVIPLNVSGPFHSSCMNKAAEGFAVYISKIPMQAPSVDFKSSVTGTKESDPEKIRQLLAQQLYSPVKWTQTMQTVGLGRGIEAGPGKVLQGLAKRIENAPTIEPAGTLEAAQALIAN